MKALIQKYEKKADGLKKYTDEKYEKRIRHLALSKIMLIKGFIQDLESLPLQSEVSEEEINKEAIKQGSFLHKGHKSWLQKSESNIAFFKKGANWVQDKRLGKEENLRNELIKFLTWFRENEPEVEPEIEITINEYLLNPPIKEVESPQEVVDNLQRVHDEKFNNTCEICKKDKCLTEITPDNGLCVCPSPPKKRGGCNPSK